jgi:hypothetical protein
MLISNVRYLSWKLYIDDIRMPIDKTFTIARTVAEAKTLIRQHGVPAFISFDHDLGIDESGNLLPTGYDFAKWIVEMDMDGIITVPSHFSFAVHSQNPVGAENIKSYLNNYLQLKS